ncbi:site-specific integrase [Halomontanus rarus]|uniref:site-specific integrase n=1 Tax=Halomontanus rarus TaxID=3034020 RepID=UPI001A9867A0
MSAEEESDEKLVSLDEFKEEFADYFSDVMMEKMEPDLESFTPKEAVDKYFQNRNLKPSTESTQRSSLYNFFVPWCDDVADITDINQLDGNALADYRVWRRDESSERVDKLSPKAEQTQQKITRGFIKYCESWDAVKPGLHEYVIIPKLDDEDEVKEEVLNSTTAKDILAWLRKYEYASVEHIVWLLLSSCGARVGGIHSLDVEDFVRDDEGAYLKFRHRPKTETTLKNERKGERDTDIPIDVAKVLEDYVNDVREEVTDDYGREPLLSTESGRMAKSTIRNYVYKWTRPCSIGQECPYGKNPTECLAARQNNHAHKCPESLSCHPVRKGYITAELEAGVPKEILSERCDVSERIMEKHYDHRTEQAKMKARRLALRMAREKKDGYGE